jgi:hypothetical protein
MSGFQNSEHAFDDVTVATVDIIEKLELVAPSHESAAHSVQIAPFWDPPGAWWRDS